MKWTKDDFIVNDDISLIVSAEIFNDGNFGNDTVGGN
ncbi:hypothetical protein G3A_15640 [Bacillus sp. 17376]|nr:hypothetical protein G3A_15640 [Bacillus sp. 17376]